MSNKRRMQRFKRRLNVRYRSEAGHERAAFTGDISRDGLYVTCAAPELPGRLLDLDIELPGIGVVQVSGEVAWCKRIPHQLQSVRRGGFGVEIRLSSVEWAELFERLQGGGAIEAG